MLVTIVCNGNNSTDGFDQWLHSCASGGKICVFRWFLVPDELVARRATFGIVLINV